MKKPHHPHSFDVVILGGGLAGLCLARQLVRDEPGIGVLILEKNQHPVPEAAFKVGESSVELAAWYFEKQLGLGDHIQQSQLPKWGLRFFFNKPHYKHIGEGLELGVSKRFPVPSYQLDRGRLENFMAGEMDQLGVRFQDGARVTGVDINEDGHKVRYLKEGEETEVTARWVVDAGGRAAILKRKLGLEEDTPHKINSVWFRLEAPVRVDDWGIFSTTHEGKGANITRWLSTNHLMGAGYWVWLIPLASGCTSIGIVADPRLHPLNTMNSFSKALEWLEKYEPQCGEQIRKLESHFMDFKALKHFSHGCKQLFSGERWAMTGEAGYFLDPFYSPGSDFIAINNTFLSALILRDLKGRPINGQAAIYDRLFKALYQNTLVTYKDLYHLFGNPTVMTFKIIWDYVVYWSFPAFVFIQNRLTDVGLLGKVQDILDSIGPLNAEMQQFFREWHDANGEPVEQIFIDQCDIDYLQKLNEQLCEPLNDHDFEITLKENIHTLHRLSAEIVEHAARCHPSLKKFMPDGFTATQHLQGIFSLFQMV